MEHANYQITILAVLMSFLILYKIFSARAGRHIFIRRIPGLAEIDEAVGRCTEMGRPVLFHPGVADFTNISTLAALGVLGHVCKTGARMGTKTIVITAVPVIIPAAEDVLKQSYASEGRSEMFDAEDVRFLAAQSDQLAMACASLMAREKTASHFFFGFYDFTSLLFSESGQHLGAVQIAGCAEYFQVPFFIASCDYTVIGEELYAASAYLTREATMLGSLIGQDYGKLIILGIVVIGCLFATAGHADLWINFIGRYK